MKEMKILVPLDGSQNAKRTIRTLFSMKEKIAGSRLTLLHVFDHDRISYQGALGTEYAAIKEQARAAARQFIEAQRELFAAEGINAEILFKEGPARKTICDIADSGEFDLLIIGRYTEGELKNLIFGQVSNYVIHTVKVPLMII